MECWYEYESFNSIQQKIRYRIYVSKTLQHHENVLTFPALLHFRCKDLDKKGILYVGSGVSGGEEGARYGPSLMPGGNAAAWPYIKDIFQVKDKIFP